MSGHVLIVGAGIAGLGLSRALAARGVPCTVVDRAPPPPTRDSGSTCPATPCARSGPSGSRSRSPGGDGASADGSIAAVAAGCCSPSTRRPSGASPRSASAAAPCWRSCATGQGRLRGGTPWSNGRARGRPGPGPPGHRGDRDVRLRRRRRRGALGGASHGDVRRRDPVLADDRDELAVRRPGPRDRLLDRVVREGRDVPAHPGGGGARLRVRRRHPRRRRRGRPCLAGVRLRLLSGARSRRRRERAGRPGEAVPLARSRRCAVRTGARVG